jgi:DNA-binding CsgD family transcriptional regulator/tetratricopeptide (TPR) repeat protein
VASGVIVESAGAVAFRHELARLAVEEALNPGRRLVLHRSALAALGKPPGSRLDMARLAHHAEAASDGSAVSRYAPEAASEAAGLGAHREAAAQYARALRHAQQLDARARLLEQRCRECYLADDSEEAVIAGRAAADAFHEMGDPLAEAGARLKLATVERITGNIAAAERSVGEALTLLGEVAPCRELALAYAATAQIAMCNGNAEETIETGRQALQLAEHMDDIDALVHVLITVGTQEMEVAATRPIGRDKLLRSIVLAKRKGLDELVGRGYNNLAYETLSCRDLRAAESCVDEAVDYCSARGVELWLNCALGSRSELQMLRGDWDGAVETAGRALGRCSTAVLRLGPLTVLGLVRARRGDPEAGFPLDEAESIARSMGELQMMVAVAAARAELAWLDGRPAGVVEETATLVERALRANDGSALVDVAYWRWQAGHALQAAEKWAPRWATPMRRHWRWQTAARRRTCGGLSTRCEPWEPPPRQASSFGVSGSMEFAAYREARVHPRPATRPGLTRREMEVVTLVAQGLRDADIAQRLYVLEKTVGHHVSALLRKLGARSRQTTSSRPRASRSTWIPPGIRSASAWG